MDKDMMFDMRHGYIVLFFYPKKILAPKITFRAVFLLFLNGLTSNPVKYQLGTLDG